MKAKYKIHYERNDEIDALEFHDIHHVREFINTIVRPSKDEGDFSLVKDTVFLIAIQDEIFVTESGPLLEELFDGDLNSAYPFFEYEGVFIKECGSYKEAYKRALNMKLLLKDIKAKSKNQNKING